jgi:hypothetical protein
VYRAIVIALSPKEWSPRIIIPLGISVDYTLVFCLSYNTTEAHPPRTPRHDPNNNGKTKRMSDINHRNENLPLEGERKGVSRTGEEKGS